MASSFNSVFEYMKGVSNTVAHERMFKAKVLDDDEQMKLVDLMRMERDTIKTTEMNILSGLSCPYKFTRGNMDSQGLTVELTSVAKGNTNLGVNHLTHTSQVRLDYTMEHQWHLKPRKANVVYSKRDSPNVINDEVLISKITAACNTLGAGEMAGITMTHALEKITQQADMKHMFMKMYLMLCDINLAATSKCEKRRIKKQMNRYLVPNVDDNTRLGAVMSHAIVVDADQFTDEELELLQVAAEEYPPVKFCGDNVYNSVRMDADDLVVLCAGNRSNQGKMEWVPDSLHRYIVSIACKLNAVEDWFSVVETMRGRPFLIREVMKRTADRTVYMDTCVSRSCTTAFGMGARVANVPREYPGYVSTSTALITDALVGHALHASASCLVEAMGGYGKLICMGSPHTDSAYHSILREYGIATMSQETNMLMRIWCRVLETNKFGWAMPIGWSDYVKSVTDEMRNGNDVPVPQVLFDCAYIPIEDSAWGITRGWSGVPGNEVSCSEDEGKMRDTQVKKTAAFLWQMGVRKTRPHAFVNTEKEGEDVLSGAEYKFMQAGHGGYTMTWLRYTILDSVGGRQDETEKEASTLIKTHFKGTRCSVVYAPNVGWSVETRVDPTVAGIAESMGMATKPTVVSSSKDGAKTNLNEGELITPLTYGGSKLVKERGLFKKVTVKGNEPERPPSPTYRPKSPTMMSKSSYRPKSPDMKFATIEKGDAVLPGEEFSYDVTQVPGDGRCGVHVVVRGMVKEGMVKEEDYDKVCQNVNSQLHDKSFHEIEDIAGFALKHGVRLRLYDEGSKMMYCYGSPIESVGRVDMVRQGAHYNLMNVGRGSNRAVPLNVVGAEHVPPNEQLATIEEVAAGRGQWW